MVYNCYVCGSMSRIIVDEFKLLQDNLYISNYSYTRQSEMANTSPCHIPVLGNVPPPPIFFRDVISLLARVFIFLIDRATQEVPIKNILKEIVRHKFFEIYAIELLSSLPSDEA